MGDQTGVSKPIDCSTDEKQLKYGTGRRCLSSELPIGDPATVDLEDDDSHISTGENSKSSGSVGDGMRVSGLAAGLQSLTESLLTMKQAEMEITKARENIRLENEKRRLESEVEMTRMLLQCQLQIASFLSTRQSVNRKRKRVQEKYTSSDSSERKMALLLGLIQLNMINF